MLDIDADGFDEMDKRIIESLIHKFGGGPVGLNSWPWPWARNLGPSRMSMSLT